VKKKYADPRRSEIIADPGDMTVEDLIAEERMVVTISHQGYIKRTDTNLYRKQKRGGKGTHRRRDQGRGLGRTPLHRHHARLHHVLHEQGKAYWLKVWELPQPVAAPPRDVPSSTCSKTWRRTRRSNPSSRSTNSTTTSSTCLRARKQGPGAARTRCRSTRIRMKKGIKAINIAEDDNLVAVKLTDG
jgi:DNA gyrase subunit A